ncbi:hypothetical protein Agsp01_32770 [Agromyces sp. NBRC 114283]|nr:hypothetical protein Agsp01_32770 [Agromyces sp. NBRC 114283]
MLAVGADRLIYAVIEGGVVQPASRRHFDRDGSLAYVRGGDCPALAVTQPFGAFARAAASAVAWSGASASKVRCSSSFGLVAMMVAFTSARLRGSYAPATG